MWNASMNDICLHVEIVDNVFNINFVPFPSEWQFKTFLSNSHAKLRKMQDYKSNNEIITYEMSKSNDHLEFKQ